MSSDAPDLWRLPMVPMIDRRLGYPAAYVTRRRWAPEVPERPRNESAWAGSKSAVSPAAPIEFRLGGDVPVFHRETAGEVARVRSCVDYAAGEAARRARAASKIRAAAKPAKPASAKPAAAWLSHTQRRDSNRVASADAPGRRAGAGRARALRLAAHPGKKRRARPRRWMRTSAHHHRVVAPPPRPGRPPVVAGALAFVPNPKTGASSRPIKTPDLGRRAQSAALDGRKERGRKHVSERAARDAYAADPAPPRERAWLAERPSAGTDALLRGEPSVRTPSWFAHPSVPRAVVRPQSSPSKLASTAARARATPRRNNLNTDSD